MKRMQSRKPIELSVKHFLTDREADGFLVSSLAVHRMLDLADAGYMDKEITYLGTDREGLHSVALPPCGFLESDFPHTSMHSHSIVLRQGKFQGSAPSRTVGHYYLAVPLSYRFQWSVLARTSEHSHPDVLTIRK